MWLILLMRQQRQLFASTLEQWVPTIQPSHPPIPSTHPIRASHPSTHQVDSLRKAIQEVGKAYANRAAKAGNKKEATAVAEEGVEMMQKVGGGGGGQGWLREGGWQGGLLLGGYGVRGVCKPIHETNQPAHNPTPSNPRNP